MFSVSGLRGIVNRDINEAVVEYYARAFAKFTGAEKTVIGRDTRGSGFRFCKAAVRGVSSYGSNVIDLGIVPTPTVLLMVRKLKADCGIVITASHNPEKWNALKFVTERGQFMNQDEFKRFARLIDSSKNNDMVKRRTQISQYGEAINDHINSIYRKLNKPKLGLKVGVDAVNGAAARALPQLCEKLGCQVVRINCRYHSVFPRGPEPVPDNLRGLSSLIRRRHLDIGLACDPDGDRLATIDEFGQPVSEEMTLVLATDYVLTLRKGTVVTNLSTTALMDYVAARHHQFLYRTRVGEGNVVAKMMKEKSVIGGEGNGGVIYPVMNFGRDALVAAALILTMLKRSGKSLHEHVTGYPSMYMIKKRIKMKDLSFDRKLKMIEKEIPGKINRQDGLRITGSNFWVHVRPSQTEPLVRIIGEASDRRKINNVIRRIGSLIKK